MGNAAAIKAGAAYVELSLKRAAFETGLSQAQKNLESFSRSFLKIGTSLSLFGSAVTAPLGYAVKRFIDFDDRLRFIKSTTESTTKQMESLEAVLRRLGRTTSFSLTDVSEAATQLALSGFNNDEIQQSIAGILDLARATRTDLPQAADIAAKVLRGFGLEASEMNRVVDILTSTATGSAQTLEDLFESIKLVTSYGRSGEAQGLEEIAASLGGLANAGLTGSLSGTSIRRIFTNLATKRDEIKKLTNIDTLDSEGNLRNFLNVLEEMNTVISKLGTGDQIKILNEVFEVRGLQSAKLIGQSISEIKTFVDRLKNSQGTAKAVSAEIDGGIGGAFRRFLSVLDEYINQVGKSLQVFGQWVDGITAAIGATSDWISKNSELVQLFAIIGVSITGTGAAFIGLGIAIGVSAFALSSYVGLIKTVSGVFGIFTGTLKAVTALVIGPVTVAFKLFAEAVTTVFKIVSAGISFIVDGFLQMGLAISRVLTKVVSELIATAAAFLSQFVHAVISGIASVVSAIVGTLLGAIASLAGSIISTLIPAFVFLAAAVVTIQSVIALAVYAAEKFNGVMNGLATIAIGVRDAFFEMGKVISAAFIEFSQVFGEVFSNLQDSFNDVSGSVMKLLKEIRSLLSQFFEIGPASERGLATATTALESFKAVVRDSVRFVSDIIQTIQENWDVAMIALQIAWRKTFILMADYFNDSFTNAIFGGRFELAAQAAFKNIETELIKMIQNVLDHFEISKDDIRSLIDSFSSIAKGVRDVSSSVVTSRADIDEFGTRIKMGVTGTIGFLTGKDTSFERGKLLQRTLSVRDFIEGNGSDRQNGNEPLFDIDQAKRDLEELARQAQEAESIVSEKFKRDIEELYKQLEVAREAARKAAEARSAADSKLAEEEFKKTTNRIADGSAGTFSAAAASRLGVGGGNPLQDQLKEARKANNILNRQLEDSHRMFKKQERIEKVLREFKAELGGV